MTSLSETSILSGSSGVSTGFTLDQSIRFNDDDSAYLSKTWSGAGDKTKFTFSCWVKRGNITSRQCLLSFRQDVPLEFEADDTLRVFLFGGTALNTNRVFRDPAAWYHIVLSVDSTAGIGPERVRLYINGVRETSFSATSYPSQNATANIYTSSLENYIGRIVNSTYYFDGYMAEIHFTDGYSYGPEYFGEFKEDTNIWTPKEVSEVTYGTNGYHIDGRDSGDLGDDESGNGNDFTSNNFAANDQVLDSPTNNHGVFNYLEKDLRYSTTLSNGNKTITFPSGSSGYSGTRLGLFRSNGKAYAEFKVGQAYSHTNGDGITVFVCDKTQDPVSAGGGQNSSYTGSYTALDGIIYAGGSNQGTGTTWNSVDAVIGVYIDFDSGKGWFSKDGTVQTVNGTPNVSNGTNPHFTFTANETLTVGAGGVHYGTVGIVTLQNHVDEWSTTPTGYTPFSTLAEGVA